MRFVRGVVSGKKPAAGEHQDLEHHHDPRELLHWRLFPWINRRGHQSHSALTKKLRANQPAAALEIGALRTNARHLGWKGNGLVTHKWVM